MWTWRKLTARSAWRAFQTWRFHFYVQDPGHDWSADNKWPCWFTDALDDLRVRLLSTHAALALESRVPFRFDVSQKYFDCSYCRYIEESTKIGVVQKDGTTKLEKTALVADCMTTYKTNGAYYSHKHSAIVGRVGPDQRITGFLTMERKRARFLVPVKDAVKQAYSSHATTNYCGAEPLHSHTFSGLMSNFMKRFSFAT